jgi:hypothetical protein
VQIMSFDMIPLALPRDASATLADALSLYVRAALADGAPARDDDEAARQCALRGARSCRTSARRWSTTAARPRATTTGPRCTARCETVGGAGRVPRRAHARRQRSRAALRATRHDGRWRWPSTAAPARDDEAARTTTKPRGAARCTLRDATVADEGALASGWAVSAADADTPQMARMIATKAVLSIRVDALTAFDNRPRSTRRASGSQNAPSSSRASARSSQPTRFTARRAGGRPLVQSHDAPE